MVLEHVKKMFSQFKQAISKVILLFRLTKLANKLLLRPNQQMFSGSSSLFNYSLINNRTPIRYMLSSNTVNQQTIILLQFKICHIRTNSRHLFSAKLQLTISCGQITKIPQTTSILQISSKRQIWFLFPILNCLLCIRSRNKTNSLTSLQFKIMIGPKRLLSQLSNCLFNISLLLFYPTKLKVALIILSKILVKINN